jgi:thiopeptide-type bacteriocin biosynthesis protein
MAGRTSPAVRDEAGFDEVSGEDRELAAKLVTVKGRALGLGEFLSRAAASLSGGNALEGRDPWNAEQFLRVRDLFIRAGLTAVESRELDTAWVHIGVQPAASHEARVDLHSALGIFARRLLSDGTISNFFFMNKQPGLRLRFEARAASTATLSGRIDREVANWSSRGLIKSTAYGIYEPESHLFGGPKSMSFVHSLFTHDSLMWLDFHGARSTRANEPSLAWLLSLAAIHALFDGLGVEGWEDVGVWARVRDATGRRLAPESQALPGYQETADGIRGLWSRRNSLVDFIEPAQKPYAAASLNSILAVARAWQSNYFGSPEAYIGPRTAAAFWVVFHWNRGGISVAQQALMAEALAARMG